MTLLWSTNRKRVQTITSTICERAHICSNIEENVSVKIKLQHHFATD